MFDKLDSHISDYPCCILTSLNCASRHFVQMLALNSQMCATSVTFMCIQSSINILRCFGYPREHNFGLVLILSPTGCTEGCVYFPQKLQEYTPPPFSRLSTQCHIDPLLVFFLSILHERVCNYSRVQSSVTGILRMGDMNIHIIWLPHVRTGPPPPPPPPPKEIAARG